MDKTGVLNFSTSLVIFLATYLQLSTVNAEGHSLHYHFTTTSSPGPGQPSYHVGGYVDDVQVVRYTSDTRRVQPLLSCLEESMDPQLWVNQTQIAKHYEIRHQQTIHDIMRIQFLNQAKVHRTTYVFQVQFWCELSGDNSIHGYEEFAANGEDFIVLDPSNIEFVALISAAETITQTWNRRSLGAERQKSYLDHECVMWLKQYLPCMEERLGPGILPRGG
ncbi:RLA class I histocompatibility antigen, alpha chain 11/11-like [Mixophyes fleayi]|uniref:RLA class I histocompatibility antigen, alpha chain 11/11-like n=1 Tax=Mixophyes fleayi TaxID=3061075 RepID=UPI003F4E1D81